MNKKSSLRKGLHVILLIDEYEKLDRLATENNISKAEVIRAAIRKMPDDTTGFTQWFKSNKG